MVVRGHPCTAEFIEDSAGVFRNVDDCLTSDIRPQTSEIHIGWPAAWTVLTDELKRYEYQIIPNGNIIYNAPRGYHDDCVIALALANSERYQFKWTAAIRLVAAAPRAARLRARGRVLAGWGQPNPGA